MEWSYVAESVWRITPPLEVVPDVTAWLVCFGLAVSLVRFVVFKRPWSCAACVLAWLGWLCWQAICVDGIQAVYSAKRRGLVALEATDHFAMHLLALVKAWIDFFLPFMSDICKWSIRVYKKMSFRMRMMVFFVGLGIYTLIEALRLFRRHKNMIMHVLFHLSFLVGGPLLWYSSGLLPPHVLVMAVKHLITTVPALLSLVVINNATDPSKNAVSSRRRAGADEQTILPTTNVKMHRLWLSYWSCWPALAVFEAGVSMFPKLVKAGNSLSLQIDLQRALLTFVVWLQFWQGSRLLHRTFQSLLFNTSFLEYVARFFGARGLWALSVLRGGIWSGASATGGMRAFSVMKQLTSRLWLFCVAMAVVGGVLLLLVTIFYRALSVVSRGATMLLWLCAASDSADTLTNDAEEFYTKKLSFWVLAIIWEGSTQLPYVGVVLRLCTPFAFTLWLLVGEVVLRRLVLPSFRIVAAPLFYFWALCTSASAPHLDAIDTTPATSPTSRGGSVALQSPSGDTGGDPRGGGAPLPDDAGSDVGGVCNEAVDVVDSAVSATGGLEDDVATGAGADTGGTGPPSGEPRFRGKGKKARKGGTQTG